MICFCLNNLRSESWMDAEYGDWSFKGTDSSVVMSQDFSGQEEWQWSGYNSRLCAGRPLGIVFNRRNDERELVERIFCGDGGCKTLTISQDRQNMYLFWELFRLWSWKIAGPALRLHAMCGMWIIGFKRRGVIWSWGASEVLKIQGLVKCWHFVKFGLCVTFDEIKNSTPECILMIF